MKKIKELFIKLTTSPLRSTPPRRGGESMKGNPLLASPGVALAKSGKGGVPGGRGGGVIPHLMRDPGVIIGAFLMVLIAGYIFHDKIPFFSATGNDPVAYWKFDEGTGSTANDSAGSNTGTLGAGNSAPAWVSDDQCISGKCLRFDGTNDYINGGTDESLNLSGNFTIGAWIKVASITNYATIVRWGEHSANKDRNLWLENGTGKLALYFYPSSTNQLKGTSDLRDNKWHYVVGTWDGTTGSVYVDGNLQNSGTLTASAFTYTGTEIGKTISTYFFPGYIDEPKIYNYARSADQIKADYASRGTVRGVAAQFGDDDLGRKLSSGLIGYWKMDEVGVSGSAWTAIDSSGNNNNGTGAGNASVGTTAPGKFGNGGFFDGTGDYVNIADSSVLEGMSNLSISAWIKATSGQSNYNYILTKQNSSVNNLGGYELFLNTSGYFCAYFDIGNSAKSSCSQTNYFDSSWHFVTATYDGTKMKVFVDGIEKNTTSATGSIGTSTIPLTIGIRNDFTFGFRGQVDEVRIYNRALDAGEVKALYQFAPGPVGYWKMDDGSGASAVDSSGNSNTGTLGTGNSAPTWTNGKFGKALSFDGSNDYVSGGNNSALNIAGGLVTLSAWVKWTASTEAYNSILGKEDGISDGYTLLLKSNQKIAVYFDGDSGFNQDGLSSTVPFGIWTNIAVVWDGTNIRTYINGSLSVSSVPSSSTAANVSNNLWIGKSIYGSGRFFNGLIDDVKIYNYARTAEQIISDMNAGHPAVGTPVGSTVLHLKMDEGYGSTANDSSPQNNDGNLATGGSAPSWTNSGKFGKALSFDGTGDYINAGSASSLDTSTLSVSLWVNPTSYSHQLVNYPISKFTDDDGSGDQGWAFGIVGSHTSCSGVDGRPFIYETTTNTNACAKSVLPTGSWSHLVFTNDGTTTKIYVNANLESDTAQTWTEAAASNLTIGRRSDGNWDYAGKIDEVKVYPFVLTADQIKTEYNHGKTQTLGATSTSADGTSPDNSAAREYCIPGDTTTCNAPVGEWNFEQASGTSAPDTSGNSNNGTLGASSAAPSWIKGKIGGALNFDGTNDYVEIGFNKIGPLINGASASTFSVWVKYATVSSGKYDNIIYASRLASDNSNIWANIRGDGADAGKILVGGRSQSGDSFQEATNATALTAGTWTHISGVLNYAGDTITIYINGAQSVSTSVTFGSSTYTHSSPSSISDTIGNNGASLFYSGLIDQVKVYNYARTAAQVAWEYNRGGPVAWYRMDECTGTTAYNAVKNGNGKAAGNNGTISIGATGTQTSAGTCSSGTSTEAWNNGTTGKYGSSLNFDGSDDYVTVGTFTNFPSGSLPRTISFWFSADTFDTDALDGILQYSPYTGVSGTQMHINAEDNAISVAFDGHRLITPKSVLSTDTWYHVAVVIPSGATSTSNVQVYINGARQTLSTEVGNAQTLSSNAADILFGRTYDNTYSYKGQIDEVKIFNYALTGKQIQTEFASGAVRFQ